MIFCMIISWTCDMHLGLQIFKSHEYKQSTKWTKIYIFSLATLWNELCKFLKNCMVYNLMKCIQWTMLNMAANSFLFVTKIEVNI
jgi:hypothetical protein